ncbi:hypothetical protein [Caulobacter sp. NIBR1757]|uniref:hypothetical protein n=1 Tax=Caulobacter sp. NIBR1757 TaxID=3016000 RepID=UPI0022F01E8D|nr:hypothetical protein [Caulobacter sp. NIBR1757]WGM40671.1 hypothetical protein AMEJIAPC_03618 [Caulobacter sp. NIBR1757]
MNLSLSPRGLRGKVTAALTAFADHPMLLHGADDALVATARQPAPAFSPTEDGWKEF